MARAKTPTRQQSWASPPDDYIRNLLFHPNAAEAANTLRDKAHAAFDSSDKGRRLAELTIEYAEYEARYTASRAILENLEEQQKHTPQYNIIPDTENAQAFRHWKTRDKVFLGLLSVWAAVAMFMGSANVYANLMSEIAFIENPWLAVTLSALMPAGATGMKFISGYFEYAKTKKRYALCVYSLTAIFMLAWSAAFAMNFNGAAGTVDWDALGEDDHGKGALLVWIQITCELLIAASIFLAIEQITHKYAPDRKEESAEFTNLERSLAEHGKSHAPLHKAYTECFGEKTVLEKEREALAQDWADHYLALHRRFNAVNSL